MGNFLIFLYLVWLLLALDKSCVHGDVHGSVRGDEGFRGDFRENVPRDLRGDTQGDVAITELAKLSLLKLRINGVSLPDFVFFKKEDRDKYRMNLLQRTVLIKENKKAFVQNYDIRKAQQMAQVLKQTVQSASKGPRNNLRMQNEEEVVTDSSSIDSLRNKVSRLKRDIFNAHRNLETLKSVTESEGGSPSMSLQRYLGDLTKKDVSEVLVCYPRGSQTPNGDLRFCGVCIQQTTLDADRFPRYLNEITCDPTSSDCLLGEGCCYQKIMYATFMVKEDSGNWNTYTQAIRTGCECELHPGSVFQPFL